MKLPNRDAAQIPKEKITHYLLSAEHRDGKHKAAFFFAHGFDLKQWELLVSALRQQITNYEVSKVDDSPFGKKFVIEGTLVSPDGRNPLVRSVWFIDLDTEIPRFVTAYPLERKNDS